MTTNSRLIQHSFGGATHNTSSREPSAKARSTLNQDYLRFSQSFAQRHTSRMVSGHTSSQNLARPQSSGSVQMQLISNKENKPLMNVTAGHSRAEPSVTLQSNGIVRHSLATTRLSTSHQTQAPKHQLLANESRRGTSNGLMNVTNMDASRSTSSFVNQYTSQQNVSADHQAHVQALLKDTQTSASLAKLNG